MQPSLSDVHVSKPLTMLSIAYMQEQSNFVATQVFPTVPVQFQTDRYYTYLRDNWFRSDAQERMPASESAGSGYTLDNTAAYFARIYAVHKDIEDAVRANSDSVLLPERDATQFVTAQLLIKREQIWINNYFQTGIWTGINGTQVDMTGVTSSPGANQFLQWSAAGSTPIEDIQNSILNVAALTGRKPNTLVIGPQVEVALRNNPEIIDRIKYSGPAIGSGTDILAQAFGVDKVLVPFAVQNSAAEGASLSNAFMYGKNALLCYSAPSPGLMQPSAGYTFSWQGYLNGTADIQVKNWYMIERAATRIEGEMAFDMKVIGSDLGIFFSNCV